MVSSPHFICGPNLLKLACHQFVQCVVLDFIDRWVRFVRVRFGNIKMLTGPGLNPRLNGSLCPDLIATFCSYGNGQYSMPHKKSREQTIGARTDMIRYEYLSVHNGRYRYEYSLR